MPGLLPPGPAVSWKRRKINARTVYAGPGVGVRQVSDRVWLVGFTEDDPGYSDEACRLAEIVASTG